MLSKKTLLFDDYYIQEVEWKTLLDFRSKNEEQVFSDSSFFRPELVMEDNELKNYKNFKKQFQQDKFRVNLLFFHKDQIIGWHQGYQRGVDSYYMQNTGILPQFRNLGIYSKSLPFIIKKITEAGLQVITSKHVASNNPVIVSKLKAGFQIAGFEISDKYGIMVKLTYFSNPKRKEVFKYRTGGKLTSPELAEYFLKKA